MTKSLLVCIIGAGPIGLTGALLLARHGIPTLLIERRPDRNTHPRSRFVDTNTMELLRELGIEKTVEATGLGPDWTHHNRWFTTLTGHEYASIPSPTFHTVPRDSSPCLPVMTCQDYVEDALLDVVEGDPNIDLRFNTNVDALEQSDNETRLTLRDLASGDIEVVVAPYAIGADGPGSMTRAVIGSALDTAPLPIYNQDVIFDADLSAQVAERKGALLYAFPGPGAGVIFQPLNGIRRWRCQISVPSKELISEDDARQRILAAIGSDDDIPIVIQSMRMWQPTPGCTTRFAQGRIFLAGDAAHVSNPAGGLGNNSGFAGIRNLAWKLAFVMKGVSPTSILDTYEEEHRPVAQARIDVGNAIFAGMAPMIMKQLVGEDFSEHERATRIYGNYDGVLLGFEIRSALIATETDPAPAVDSVIKDFVPTVRSGRRAPHVWIDSDKQQSLLDAFGGGYVIVLGADVPPSPWVDSAGQLSAQGFPIEVSRLPSQLAKSPYLDDHVVLVRPDGIIADHWQGQSLDGDRATRRLTACLPLAPGIEITNAR